MLIKVFLASLLVTFSPFSYGKKDKLCNYAGHISVVSDDGVCLKPWDSIKSILSERDYLDDPYIPCGVSDWVRCSPIVYGSMEDNKGNKNCLKGKNFNLSSYGCCIKIKKKKGDDAGVANDSCSTSLMSESKQINNFMSHLEKNQKRLSAYLNYILIIYNSCKDKRTKRCKDFKKEVSSLSSKIASDTRLMCSMINAMPYEEIKKLEEILKVTKSYRGSRNRKILKGQEKLLVSRKEKLDKLLAAHAKSDELETVLDELKKKAKPRPAGKCYSYVKTALNTYFTKYPYSAFAKYAVNDLVAGKTHNGSEEEFVDAKYEFVNLTDLGLSLDPNKAPHGSIIVYDPIPYKYWNSNKKSYVDKAGHIEIVKVKNGSRTFWSDYKDTQPISDDLPRIPTAIIVPAKKDLLKKLGIKRICKHYVEGTDLCAVDRLDNGKITNPPCRRCRWQYK